MNAEITWDLVMSEDMPFAEGCYRTDGGEWQVVTATKARPGCPASIRENVSWASGATGLNIVFPPDDKINASSLKRIMSEVLAVEDLYEVVGPDSMTLR